MQAYSVQFCKQPNTPRILKKEFNPLNAELNLICHLLALLAHHILHISRIRVNNTYSVQCAGNHLCTHNQHTHTTKQYTRTLPHVSKINRHPEGDVNTDGYTLSAHKFST